MYLSHHYAVDLVGGTIRKTPRQVHAEFWNSLLAVAAICFFAANAIFLPRLQSEKFVRWDYDFVEIGESFEESQKVFGDQVRDIRILSDSDEWTLGSSTALSSGTRSPSTENKTPIDDILCLWDGDTIGSGYD